MQDTVKAAVDEARFSQVIDQMREAAESKITGDIPEVVELTSRELKFTKDESIGILNHLIRDGDFSLYGLANAVTKHSQKITSYDRATDLEAAGYSVLTMNPSGVSCIKYRLLIACFHASHPLADIYVS